MRAATQHYETSLGGQRVDYLVRQSKSARKLRLRVGLNGIEIVVPPERTSRDATAFLSRNETWVLSQLQRIDRLRKVRKHRTVQFDEILFRGVPTKISVELVETRARGNIVRCIDGKILVQRGGASRIPVERSLENWLRRQARLDIGAHLKSVTSRLRQSPMRIYVMGQRTKWGNCSRKRNLSFNWRLILAPEFVLQYLVTHEAAHLAVPDHSAKFWLTVQSLCAETERAKQWLAANGHKLTVEHVAA
ncbi:MAG: M48 family metallopeptidase [Chloroflexota bacterium]|nr:M48 family metallopeptidase [Chloroflexota bacterium]